MSEMTAVETGGAPVRIGLLGHGTVGGALDEIKSLLQYAFKTGNRLTIPVSAPGSAGMETCFVNLLEPGDKAIVYQNGVFGGRMQENVERCGGAPKVE